MKNSQNNYNSMGYKENWSYLLQKLVFLLAKVSSYFYICQTHSTNLLLIYTQKDTL